MVKGSGAWQERNGALIAANRQDRHFMTKNKAYTRGYGHTHTTADPKSKKLGADMTKWYNQKVFAQTVKVDFDQISTPLPMNAINSFEEKSFSPEPSAAA